MTIDPKCCTLTRVSNIKVEEFGRKAVIVNKNNTEHNIIRVDGCVITTSGKKSADWIISRKAYGDAIIELKGKDVEHAVKQVLATAHHWRQNDYQEGKIAALIVSTQFPKTNTAVQRSQQEFAKIFKGPLHVVTKNYAGYFEAIFSFGGPHKI